MAKLRCISRYRSARRTVEVGAVLDLTDAEAQSLIADAPGCWADADAPPAPAVPKKALDEPPADTMVKRAPVKK